MVREVLQLATDKSSPSRPSTRALIGFVVYTAGAWRSAHALLDNCLRPHPTGVAAFDFSRGETIANMAAAVLRCAYDAYIQASFIVHDPSMREQQAELYLSFFDIERYVQEQEVLKQSNRLASHLQHSPLRQAGSKRLKDAYDRAAPRFATKDGKGVRKTHWYPGSLLTLAEAAGLRDEYMWFVKGLNSAVHAGPMAIRFGPAFPIEHMGMHASMIVARTAKLLTENESLTISDDSSKTLADLSANLLDA